VQVVIFAAACGLTVANIFYTQPLIGLIWTPPWGCHAGPLPALIVTLTQTGLRGGAFCCWSRLSGRARESPPRDCGALWRRSSRACSELQVVRLGGRLSWPSSFVVGVCSRAAHARSSCPFASHLAPESFARPKGSSGNVMFRNCSVESMFGAPVSRAMSPRPSGWRAGVLQFPPEMMLTLPPSLLLSAGPCRGRRAEPRSSRTPQDSSLACRPIVASRPRILRAPPLSTRQ